MNYQKIYNQLVERGKNRITEEYTEKHHIIPKCMGGGNEIENIVKLTAREHFIAHWLLSRLYPNNIKINRAFWLMANSPIPNKKRYIPSSRAYKEAKEKLQMWIHNNRPEGFGNMITSHPTRGNKISESLQKYYKNNPLLKKKPKSDESKKKISLSKTGSTHTESTKNKIGKNQPKEKPSKRKKVDQFDKNNNFIKTWDSIAEATLILNLPSGCVSMACSGKIKSAGGFIWKYK
jgi:hypothetical protein